VRPGKPLVSRRAPARAGAPLSRAQPGASSRPRLRHVDLRARQVERHVARRVPEPSRAKAPATSPGKSRDIPWTEGSARRNACTTMHCACTTHAPNPCIGCAMRLRCLLLLHHTHLTNLEPSKDPLSRACAEICRRHLHPMPCTCETCTSKGQ